MAPIRGSSVALLETLTDEQVRLGLDLVQVSVLLLFWVSLPILDRHAILMSQRRCSLLFTGDLLLVKDVQVCASANFLALRVQFFKTELAAEKGLLVSFPRADATVVQARHLRLVVCVV